ncbi:type VII secretion integral membrane protein EccD [Mycobacterium sp. ACS1612]|nr:type VII secretion integral membrane protein EccD [Mycobacterium sp. ACS1612]
MDVSLPQDVPIGLLLPDLMRLVRSRETIDAPVSEREFPKDANRIVWSLIRLRERTPLQLSNTLRQEKIVDGELLRLTSERALSAPTLYDDVVDAAARLNKTGYPSWNATAARWMAFAGVYLASAMWVYFLVARALRPNRPALVGLSVVVAVALVGVGALACRSYGRSDVGAAMGWASIPIFSGVVWAGLSGVGGYGLAAGSAGMVGVCYAVFRAIGTGHWGYLGAGLFFAASSGALAAHAVGVGAPVVGAATAAIATLSCLAVPMLKTRSARLGPSVGEPRGNRQSADPFLPDEQDVPEQAVADSPAVTTNVWERVRTTTLTRAGIYAGLASSAVVGASTILTSSPQTDWPSVAFTSACAAALGIYAQRATTAVERAALAVPAFAVTVMTCAVAQSGRQPMPPVAFAVLLVSTVASAFIAVKPPTERLARRTRQAVDYMTYLATAAVIPLALWAVGAFAGLGIS